MNSLSPALLSGSIRLHEGLEVMLVIAALAAILRRTGAAHDERPEAVAMLLASLLML
jgi:hypothetical protein